jgi:hypothetical protein
MPDFETARRQRNLSNSQPLVINWEFILAAAIGLLNLGALCRLAYLLLHGWRP